MAQLREGILRPSSTCTDRFMSCRRRRSPVIPGAKLSCTRLQGKPTETARSLHCGEIRLAVYSGQQPVAELNTFAAELFSS